VIKLKEIEHKVEKKTLAEKPVHHDREHKPNRRDEPRRDRDFRDRDRKPRDTRPLSSSNWAAEPTDESSLEGKTLLDEPVVHAQKSNIPSAPVPITKARFEDDDKKGGGRAHNTFTTFRRGDRGNNNKQQQQSVSHSSANKPEVVHEPKRTERDLRDNRVDSKGEDKSSTHSSSTTTGSADTYHNAWSARAKQGAASKKPETEKSKLPVVGFDKQEVKPVASTTSLSATVPVPTTTSWADAMEAREEVKQKTPTKVEDKPEVEGEVKPVAPSDKRRQRRDGEKKARGGGRGGNRDDRR
jgi:hypothetical protein